MSINVKQGNLFENLIDYTVVPHVTNDCGYYSSGFVAGITKCFGTKPKESYQVALKNKYGGLGYTNFCAIKHKSMNITVANMCAQHGVWGQSIGNVRIEKPIRYGALIDCMRQVRDYCKKHNRGISCPKFGSLRAGGEWSEIRHIIEEIWGDLDVTVWEY